MFMLLLFSSCSEPRRQNFYFPIMIFVKMHRELFQAVLGGDDVTSGVLGVLTSMLLNSLLFLCRFYFLISSYKLLIF